MIDRKRENECDEIERERDGGRVRENKCDEIERERDGGRERENECDRDKKRAGWRTRERMSVIEIERER